MKKCIYFPLMGDYDKLREPTIITPGWDYICYTNNYKLKSKHWNIRFVESDLDDARFARKVWILNHKYAKGYDISISIGAQIQPTCDLNIFQKVFLPQDDKVDMSMPKHPSRICLYHEANECIAKRKDNPEIISSQIEFYKKEGYPKNNGLVACGIIIRKHNRLNIEEHCEKWWKQVKEWSLRDQLSFNYILWKYNLVNIHYFNYDIVRGKGNYFKKYSHKRSK